MSDVRLYIGKRLAKNRTGPISCCTENGDLLHFTVNMYKRRKMKAKEVSKRDISLAFRGKCEMAGNQGFLDMI